MITTTRVPLLEKAFKRIDSLVTRGNNQLDGSLKENIFFLHLHKCGGTSIGHAIKSCYHTLDTANDRRLVYLNSEASFNAALKGVDQVDQTDLQLQNYVVWKFRENLLLYYMSNQKTQFISGHFSFSETAYRHFSNKYAFVTVLRDPVKRWISAYFFNRYKNSAKQHGRIETDITEFLKSERGKVGGSGYVSFLGGPHEGQDYTSERAINRAKENLHKFRVVGCLEYMDEFLNQFEEQFGKRLKIRVLNQSPKPEAQRKTVISEEIKEEIRQICQPNIEIYQYALDNFVKAKH